MTDSLPTPPIDSDVDLTDFAFMPLQVARLRKSKAWLICKRRPELAFYMINLWSAAWHEKPSGSLEDDDDVLADLAMCPPKEWPKLREDVLRGWVKCSDGRLYHQVVVEVAQGAWNSKLIQRHERECDRLRKENNKRRSEGKPPHPIPDFDEWKASRGQRRSTGIPPLSTGTPAEILKPSPGIPAENALKGREGKGRDRDIYSDGKIPAESRGGNDGQLSTPVTLPAALTFEQAQECQRRYPVGIYRQSDWLVAEKLINQHLANGVPFDTIIASFERSRCQQEAKGNIGREFVPSPVKHCDLSHPQFDEPFPLPVTKTERRTDSNLEAAREAKRRLFGDAT